MWFLRRGYDQDLTGKERRTNICLPVVWSMIPGVVLSAIVQAIEKWIQTLSRTILTTVRALIQKPLGRGRFPEFLGVFVVFVIFLGFPAGFPTLPALS